MRAGTRESAPLTWWASEATNRVDIGVARDGQLPIGPSHPSDLAVHFYSRPDTKLERGQALVREVTLPICQSFDKHDDLSRQERQLPRTTTR